MTRLTFLARLLGVALFGTATWWTVHPEDHRLEPHDCVAAGCV